MAHIVGKSNGNHSHTRFQ